MTDCAKKTYGTEPHARKERKGNKVANHVGDRGGEVNVRAKSEEKTDTHIHDEEYVLAKIFHARPTIILILRRRRFLSLSAPRRLNDRVSFAQPRSVHLD